MGTGQQYLLVQLTYLAGLSLGTPSGTWYVPSLVSSTLFVAINNTPGVQHLLGRNG